MKHISIILVSLLAFYSCKKDENGTKYLFDGKVKSINLYSYQATDTFIDSYVFSYDSISGLLTKGIHNYNYPNSVVSNVDSVIISMINDTTIRLTYFDETSTPNEYSYYAYLNNLNQVYAITNQFPYQFNPENIYLYFNVDSNQKLDTIYEPQGIEPAFGQTVYSRSWNIIRNGENYTQITTYSSYDPLDIISGIPQTTYNYSFTSFQNIGLVPMQRIYAYGFNWTEAILEPMYLLNLSGFNHPEPNKQLILNFNNGGHTYTYNYTYNSKNQVTGLNFDNQQFFELEYY